MEERSFKIYITRINGWSLRDKTHCMQHIVSEIAHQMGCREMGIYRYPADGESIESLGSRLDGIIAGINRGDLVICQFPTGNGLRFERELANRLRAYGGRAAILIHELEALAYEEKKFQFGEIINLYNQAIDCLKLCNETVVTGKGNSKKHEVCASGNVGLYGE